MENATELGFIFQNIIIIRGPQEGGVSIFFKKKSSIAAVFFVFMAQKKTHKKIVKNLTK